MAAVTATVAAAGPVTTEFGHSVPPEGPHTVTFHVPGWDTAIRFRDGDLSIFAKLRSIYPRFTPFGPARQVRLGFLFFFLMYSQPARTFKLTRPPE